MDPGIRDRLLTRSSLAALGLAGLATLGSPTLSPRQTDSLPAGVTLATVERGKKLFQGAGLCLACHGVDAKGGTGPDLTDSIWLHHDGSYEALVPQILQGIDQKTSKGGQIMPPRGGSGLNEKDIRAIAGYVWTLSRKPPKPF
jgi:mono/diheme cytochrome c family protein